MSHRAILAGFLLFIYSGLAIAQAPANFERPPDGLEFKKNTDWYFRRGFDNVGRRDHSAVYFRLKTVDQNSNKITGTIWTYKPNSTGKHIRQNPVNFEGTPARTGNVPKSRKYAWKALLKDTSVQSGGKSKIGWLTATIRYDESIQLALRLRKNFSLEGTTNCDDPPDDDILEEEGATPTGDPEPPTDLYEDEDPYP